MATYREVKGYSIKSVSSDPANVKEGQIWYNSSAKAIKVAPLLGAWSSGSNTPGSYMASGTGTQTATLIFGGAPPGPGGGRDTSFEYDGTNWTAGGDLADAVFQSAGIGIQTAAIDVSGRSGPGAPGIRNTSEEYNGSSWTAGENVNTKRYNLQGFGISTAGVIAGGQVPGYTAATEEYNGTSWSSGENMNTARGYLAGFGTLTAGVCCGGLTPASPTNTAATENYDGTDWTNSGNVPEAQGGKCGAGTQTAGLAFGGDPSNKTHTYDGSTWADLSATLTTTGARRHYGSMGTRTEAIACGTPNSDSTEEWNEAVTTRTVDVS